MRSLGVAFLAAGALAGNAHKVLFRQLHARQAQSSNASQAFDLGSEIRNGRDCASAFGPGYIICTDDGFAPLCYNPRDGQSCCAGDGEPYVCPVESFCLNVDGLCCPEGLDADTCASQDDVSIPDNVSATITGASSTSTSAPSGNLPKPEFTATAQSSPETDSTAPAGSGASEGGDTAGAPCTAAGINARVIVAGLVAGLLGIVAILL